MFLQRLLVALLLLPIGLWALFTSEYSFAIFMGLVCIIASWEYTKLFQIGEYRPATFAIIGTVISSMVLVVYYKSDVPLISVVPFVLFSAFYHVKDYERGRELAVLDFTISLAGILYLGVLGSYFLAIRVLPGGDWWIFTILTCVWWADTGAYFIGKGIGKHALAPRLSPKKTWEGYFGGIIMTLIGSPLLLIIYWKTGLPVIETITIPKVLLIAAVLGVFPTIGDLTISMIKRYFKVKDTGKILAGHGGMLDRIDSWLWAVSIGYYLIIVLGF